MKALQNQNAALRMPLSALGAVRRPLFWMGCAFLLTVWLLLALPGWTFLPCAAGGILCIGWLSQGSPRYFLPLLFPLILALKPKRFAEGAGETPWGLFLGAWGIDLCVYATLFVQALCRFA